MRPNRLSIKSGKVPRNVASSKLYTILGLLVGLFVTLAALVKSGYSYDFDKVTLITLNSLSTATVDAFVTSVTHFGDVIVVMALSLLLMQLLYFRGQYKSMIQVVFALVGGAVLNIVFKILFARDRPELWQLLAEESTYSFPSGHSLMTAVLAVTVIFLFWGSRYRTAVVISGMVYVATIGLTRLYLGVHYPTDVLAGWSMGAAWAICSALLVSRLSYVKKLQ